MHPDTQKQSSVLLIGPEQGLLDGVAGVLAPVQNVQPVLIVGPVEQSARDPRLAEAAVVVVDLDPRRSESLAGLRTLMTSVSPGAPVIVLTDSFDDGLARWFLQIRVADFLRKPVQPKDVLRSCVQALRAGQGLPEQSGRIHALLPALGGVGNTTLAIETAMILLREGKEPSTCLVDLDFQSSSCAEYLDIQPRLNLEEVGQFPERMDQQLLEVMLSVHGSGLAVLAAPGRPAQPNDVSPDFVLRMLDVVSARFRNVVIDLPRRWDPWTDAVLGGSNAVFVVTDMTVPGLRQGRNLAKAIAERLPEVEPRVVVNRFQQTSLFGTGLRKADAESALGKVFAGAVANNYALVREAIDRGLPLESVKAGNTVTADLRKIVLAPDRP
ncbi:response regulator receiver protein [Alsobacter soli]|uniref:Response regulator receiver protein n=1 Tax=Alsobacter soli TaxID=2109933 RepID=A0A2T1HQ41_9HYPH|nr:CobQ/CobB/MinD/ParA nucleotide binding domain-containing protein [Alsobacter soli]PSC03756.1 response regulator receiver protein [Alsobacter soli]